MAARALDVRVLKRAAEILGGEEKLRRVLNVSAAVLALWMGGAEAMPTDAFLKAVDVIEEKVVDDLTAS